MTDKPLVSLIVRTMDRQKQLIQALQSISIQTYRPIEVVIVNDGGCALDTEELGGILGDISLNYIRLKSNTGRAHAGNVGIENAKGEFIGFLDDDDELYADHVYTLTEFLRGNQPQIGFTDCEVISVDGEEFSANTSEENRVSVISMDFSFDELLAKNYVPFMCVMFPRQIINEFSGLDENFDLYEDWDLLIRIASKYQLCHIKKVTAKYYIWSKHLQITQYAKYAGTTGKAFSKIFNKHHDKYTYQTIQNFVRERELLKEDFVREKELLKENFEKKLEKKEDELQRIRNEKIEKEFALSEIYNSLSWKLLSKYRNIKQRLFPVGTKRRGVYDLFLRSFHEVEHQGFMVFLHKAKAKLSREVSGRPVKQYNNVLSYKIRPLSMPRYAAPLVSIVIPVFNKVEYTFNCLESIHVNTQDVHYEIIVVDDASTDNTERVLKDIENISIISHSTNLGFIAACNNGARTARGTYILFLNNDIQVTKGWLSRLLEPMRNNSSAGIVGAKLIYPDGKLQEAGNIIWNDGSAWNYGKYDDPDQPEYNYLRKVDYCSGACILVRKDLFEQAGGFDNRYYPAYYEDTDLALTFREMGYSTIYQPEAEIIHFEGTTAGTDLKEGVKKFQEVNRKKFREKWKYALTDGYHYPGKDIFRARETNSGNGKRILFIDHYVPTYDKDAGSVRTFEYLKIFIDLGFQITFWPDNLARLEPYTGTLQQLGIEVIYGTKNFKKYIHKFGKYFDIAILSRPHIAVNYINEIRQATDIKIVYDSHDLVFLREIRRAEIESNSRFKKVAMKSKKDELFLSTVSDAVLVLSAYERDLLLKENPGLRVYLVPLVYPIPTATVKPFHETEGLFFIAGFVHPPNEDAALWFVHEVLPLIHRELPDVVLNIVGSHPTNKIMKLSSEKIRVYGFVHDVSHFFCNSRIFVAPLRYGAGAKGKIIQSMSYGLPVVTTGIGAEGLDLADGNDAAIAEDPSEFARKVVELYRDEDTWNSISKNSIESMKKRFSEETAKKEFRKFFADLGFKV